MTRNGTFDESINLNLAGTSYSSTEKALVKSPSTINPSKQESNLLDALVVGC